MSERNDFEVELERRLELLESPEYEDPARRDLPSIDLVVIGVVVVLLVALMYWWGR